MAWMIREDQLDGHQKDFINKVNGTDNLLYISIERVQSIYLSVHSARQLKNQGTQILAPNNFVKRQLLKRFSEIGYFNSEILLYEEWSELESDNVIISILPTQEEVNKLSIVSNRFIIFSDSDYHFDVKVDITKNINHLLHFGRNSQIELSYFINNSNNNSNNYRRDSSKVDSTISIKEFINEGAEFEYIFQECNKYNSISGNSIILFPNEFFLLRFVFFLFDKAFFDLATIEHNGLDIIEQSNELLIYYGMPYVIINENKNIDKYENKNLIVLSTYNSALFLCGEGFDFGAIPFTQKIVFNSQRALEISKILINLNFNHLAVTSSSDFIIPNSLTENMKKSNILKK